MSADNWYQEGLDAAAETIRKETEEADRRKNMPRRFFVKPGTNSTIMWIDDAGFSVWEHIPFIPGKPNQEFTCSAKMGLPCAGCERQIWSRFNTFFTILDLTQYVGKNGPVVNERRLLAAPPDFAMRVRHWKAQPANDLLKWPAGTLRGRKFSIFRAMGDKSNIGSGWDPIPEPPLTQAVLQSMRDGNGNPVMPTHTAVFDYRTILAPIPYEEQLRRVTGHVSKFKPGTAAAGAAAAAGAPGAPAVGGGPGAPGIEGASPTDDVPF